MPLLADVRALSDSPAVQIFLAARVTEAKQMIRRLGKTVTIDRDPDTGRFGDDGISAPDLSLDKMRTPELRERARAKGVKGYSKMRKAELVAALKGDAGPDDGSGSSRVDDIVEALNAATNREAARGRLAGLSVADLRVVADKLGMRRSSGRSRKADLVEDIVEFTAGSREDSRAIRLGSRRDNGKSERSGDMAAMREIAQSQLAETSAEIRKLTGLPNPRAATADDGLDKMLTPDLRKLARDEGVPGAAKLRKAELIEGLRERRLAKGAEGSPAAPKPRSRGRRGANNTEDNTLAAARTAFAGNTDIGMRVNGMSLAEYEVHLDDTLRNSTDPAALKHAAAEWRAMKGTTHPDVDAYGGNFDRMAADTRSANATLAAEQTAARISRMDSESAIVAALDGEDEASLRLIGDELGVPISSKMTDPAAIRAHIARSRVAHGMGEGVEGGNVGPKGGRRPAGVDGRGRPSDGLDDMQDHQLRSLADEFEVPRGSRGEMLAGLRAAGAVSPKVRRERAEAEAAVTPERMQSDVTRVYDELAAEWDNEWVTLDQLRKRLGGTREEQDAALRQLVADRKVRLIPEENQKTLTPGERDAALSLGGEDKHLIGIPAEWRDAGPKAGDPLSAGSREDQARTRQALMSASLDLERDVSESRAEYERLRDEHRKAQSELGGKLLGHRSPGEEARVDALKKRRDEASERYRRAEDAYAENERKLAKAVGDQREDAARTRQAQADGPYQSRARDMGEPTHPQDLFPLGTAVKHRVYGDVTYHGTDEADVSGRTHWIRTKDGDERMVSSTLTPVDPQDTARQRQARIDSARSRARAIATIEKEVSIDESPDAARTNIDAILKQHNLDGTPEGEQLRAAVASGDRARVLAATAAIAEANGLRRIGGDPGRGPDQLVPFDRTKHTDVYGRARPGDKVIVAKPGYESDDGVIEKADVFTADPEDIASIEAGGTWGLGRTNPEMFAAPAPAPAAPPKPARGPRPSKVDMPAVKAELDSMRAAPRPEDRQRVKDLLAPMSKADLASLADQYGWSNSVGGTKPQMRDQLHDLLIGNRLTAQAIMDRRGGPGTEGPRSQEQTRADVTSAYARLATRPGELVSLARLRALLPDVSHDELTRILKQMDRERLIQLDPDPNTKALPPEAHAAAVVIGGEPKHFITLA